jgi:tetratricopeptide (TPR) repeat protein
MGRAKLKIPAASGGESSILARNDSCRLCSLTPRQTAGNVLAGGYSYLSCYLLAMVMTALVISCGPKAMQPLSRLDTPEHHTSTGIKLLLQEKCADAGREFTLALKLDPGYAKAAVGAGMVKACRGDFGGAAESLEQAKVYVRSDEELLFVLAGQIHMIGLSRAPCLKIGSECPNDSGWLDRAKETFDRALRIDPTSGAVHYYMGECYLAAFDLEAAGRMFSRALDLNRGYVGQADARWKLVQKIRRAKPATVMGRKIALFERITRAEATALFMEELQIDKLYTRLIPKVSDAALKDRVTAPVTTGPDSAADIVGHPLRADIEGVIRIGVRGLDVTPDGAFRPEELVDRASYAMMIEDILIRITGDRTLATRYVGNRSPFPDLRADLPYFNAVMVVTSRGIMEVTDTRSGAFAPREPVGGADALLVIRKIREEIR